METYICHKKVQAMKIVTIVYRGGKWLLIGPNNEQQRVTKNWLDRHGPIEGGYFIRYKDGYESYSSAEPFEAGYILENEAEMEAG